MAWYAISFSIVAYLTLIFRRIANFGFSIGINDVIPGPSLSANKDRLVEEAYGTCDDFIAQAKKGKLENKPGCNQDQTLEAMISGVLSKVRDNVGDLCMKELSRHNAPYIMATCGSKGELRMSIHRSFAIDAPSTQVPSSTSVRW